MSLSWFLTLVAYLGLAFLPVSPPAATPAPADAPACDTSPRRLADIVALGRGRTPDGGLAELIGGTPVPMPAGRPADAATAEAVIAVGREAAACFAAGEPLRGLALFTDDLVARIVALESEEGLGASLALFGHQEMIPYLIGQHTLFRLDGSPRVLVPADDRAAVLAAFAPTPTSLLAGTRPFHLLFLFREVDPGWLLDDVVAVETPG
jgi:hypothetical protein